MDRQEILEIVETVIANVLQIPVSEISPGSNLVCLGLDQEKHAEVLSRLQQNHKIRLNLESGLAQITVQGLCNYVVCQLLPVRARAQSTPKVSSVCHWVF
jgi:aryl carrier-like protein